MSQIDAMTILERTKPRLVAEARKMREDGKSFDDIASFLSTRLSVRIGRETVRRWFQKQG
jgi:hypothetical protein